MSHLVERLLVTVVTVAVCVLSGAFLGALGVPLPMILIGCFILAVVLHEVLHP